MPGRRVVYGLRSNSFIVSDETIAPGILDIWSKSYVSRVDKFLREATGRTIRSIVSGVERVAEAWIGVYRPSRKTVYVYLEARGEDGKIVHLRLANRLTDKELVSETTRLLSALLGRPAARGKNYRAWRIDEDNRDKIHENILNLFSDDRASIFAAPTILVYAAVESVRRKAYQVKPHIVAADTVPDYIPEAYRYRSRYTINPDRRVYVFIPRFAAIPVFKGIRAGAARRYILARSAEAVRTIWKAFSNR